MNRAICLLFLFFVGSSFQWDALKTVNSFDFVVEQLQKLREAVSFACYNLPAGASEVYRVNEYRLVVPNVDVDDKVAVKVQDLVLGVNVVDVFGRVVNVVRVLPAVVDVRQAYFTRQNDHLVVVVPYSRNTRVVDLDCSVENTRAKVLNLPERNVWVDDLRMAE